MSLIEEDVSTQEVNDKLDSLSLEILHLMNEVIQSKLQLEQVTRNGCLSLAKARYVMGNRNVSTLQLPTEDSAHVNALATVVTTKDMIGDLNKVTFQLQRVSPQDKRQKSPKSGLKKRPGKEYDEPDEEDNDEECDLLLEETNDGVVQDPIKWFGVLVPQNLRNSQKCYQKAVELSVEIANIQSKLQAATDLYQKQMKDKIKFYKEREQ